MEIVYILIGIIAGGLIGYLIAARKTALLRTQLAMLQEHDRDLLRTSQQQATQLSASQQALAVSQTEKKALEERLQNQKQEIETLHKQFNLEFENIANKIFQQKTESFNKLSTEKLTLLLKPFDDNLKEFRHQVNEVYDKESKQRFSLEEKIKELAMLNKQISDEANNLTKALKGDSKAQGNWGEMILERMLEESGLRKGEEYFVQENCITEDGRNVRPDIIIRFPEKRCVIVDSKVSLTAYVNYINSTSYNEQAQALSAHVASIREHINELAVKDYSKVVKDSIGYVLMFVPNEGSYIAALEKDRELLNYAYKKHIIIISPSNLMMALQLAYNLWQSEKQSRNVEEIIRRGNLLYEKFVTFITTFEKIGKQLDETKKQYESAFGTLARGNGNIISSFNKMKELGLTPKRNIPTEVIEKTENIIE